MRWRVLHEVKIIDINEKTFLEKRKQFSLAVNRAGIAMQHSRLNFADPNTLRAFLIRVQEVNSQSGFLSWDPDMLQENPIGEPGEEYPRLKPVTKEHPRLFISYGWATDDGWNSYETDLWVDAFAGSLFNRGYDIYFDRDPRNVNRLVNWLTVLSRMRDCNYFVAILTDDYVKRITDSDANGPLVAEWKHALMLYPEFMSIVGIRFSDLELPKPFTRKNMTAVSLLLKPLTARKTFLSGLNMCRTGRICHW